MNPKRDIIQTRRDAIRLVADDPSRNRPTQARQRKLAVAEEMLRAREATVRRTLDPQDPRWMLAVATRDALQGAVLTFENRRKVLLLAQRVGIRAFDANLIVAIVQDRARRGEPIECAADSIRVIPSPAQRQGFSATAWMWAAAITVAVLADALLIGWLILR